MAGVLAGFGRILTGGEGLAGDILQAKTSIVPSASIVRAVVRLSAVIPDFLQSLPQLTLPFLEGALDEHRRIIASALIPSGQGTPHNSTAHCSGSVIVLPPVRVEGRRGVFRSSLLQ
ncbi:hypothetical protein C7W88_17060 [Novosphingobium sp. THN1]|nr:hypothetical protein C7W88_17060 [Novosphingobium sp. THN1]